MLNSARGHLFDHMPKRYCQTCAGSGVLGLFRWCYVPELKKVMPFEPERCPTCQGAGKNKWASKRSPQR
jgi:DnaJ-class molecular chaperone